MYELPHELPDDRQKIRKHQENVKTSQNDSLVPSPHVIMKILLKLAQKFWKTEIKLSLWCAILHEN